MIEKKENLTEDIGDKHIYYKIIDSFTEKKLIQENDEFSFPIYFKNKGQIYSVIFIYEIIEKNQKSQIIGIPNRLIVSDLNNSKLKIYNKNITNNKLSSEDFINITNMNDIKQNDVDKYLAAYDGIKSILFKPKNKLTYQENKLLKTFIEVFYQTIQIELIMYYHYLSPEFFEWMEVADKQFENQEREILEDKLEKIELIIQPLNKIEERLDHITKTFDESIKYDQYKEKLFDNMHKELTNYRNGLLDKITNNISMDIIKIIDSTSKTIKTFEEKEFNEENYKRLLRQFSGIAEDLQDILYYQDIEPYIVDGDEVDVKRQKIIKVIETNDTILDKKVAERLASGYEKKGKVIRPERVNIYKYTNKGEEVN